MTTLREAAQQALEALEGLYLPLKSVNAAITALRAALAQQAEPVAWLQPKTVDAKARPDLGYETCSKDDYGAFPVYRASPKAEPVQEPVVWRYKPMIGSPWSLSDDGYYISCMRDKGYIVEPLYPAPPQRKPLTEEEIFAIENDIPDDVVSDRHWTIWYARAIERAHGIVTCGDTKERA